MTKTKVLIMSQGEGSRWKPDVRWSHVDVPAEVKQLIPLGNETILTRTLRQISEFVPQMAAPVVINRKYSHYLPSGTAIMSLDEPTGFLLRGIQIAFEWAGVMDRTVVLLGDVVYSNDAIQKIFMDTQFVSLYGRLSGNPITGKEAKELFAFAFHRKRSEHVMGVVFNFLINRGRPTARLWDLFDYFVAKAGGVSTLFVPIGDYTDDCDSIQEYILFFDKLEKAALEDDERLHKD